jgi:tetratricopeptide (TPR) repeat protein
VKINRAKLNAILRSGLHPQITTRKLLAAHLNLDPTSLTRWFATTDRLGNPRFPVVPDRHVTAILQTFSLEASSLSLSDEDFRQYCFDRAVQHAQSQEQTTVSAEKNHHAPQQEKNSIARRYIIAGVATVMLSAIGLAAINVGKQPAVENGSDNLQVQLNNQIQQSRDRGVKELQQGRYQLALNQFEEAFRQLVITPVTNTELKASLIYYAGLAHYGQGPWRYGRQFYESNFDINKANLTVASDENTFSADDYRNTARSEMELGKDFLARSFIESALDHDSRAMLADQPTMASNWLLLSQIQALQGQLLDAKASAIKAIDLDGRLFGEKHPRTAEDQMTLSMIVLLSGDLESALSLYRGAYNTFIEAGLSFESKRPEPDILKSLRLMKALSDGSVSRQNSGELKQALDNLNNSLNASIPYISRRYAGVLWRDAIHRGLI